ncbi:MAG: ATP-binding cassette domain-containing protein [Steroidobacteraceae bacterium]
MSEAPAAAATVLEARGVVRRFRQGPVTLEVLQGLDLAVRAGERLAIIGASGSGKTTLLQILGGLDRPDAGSILVDGRDIHSLDEAARGALRNRTLGFVYQFHHLLPEFSALENVALPLLVRRESAAAASARARAARSRRPRRAPHAPARRALRWRAAARRRGACAGDRPRLVLADEPTGNLDGRNAEQVFALMLELNRELGTALVVVTHDAPRGAHGPRARARRRETARSALISPLRAARAASETCA